MLKFSKPIYLASASPRRVRLLNDMGIEFTQIKVHVDEEKIELEMAHQPHLIPEVLARAKAEAGLSLHSEGIVIGADTLVVLEGKVLSKPKHSEEAKEMLARLSGKPHKVYTGLCVLDYSNTYHSTDVSEVYFKLLTQDMINYYVDTFQPLDKAGAYGAQDWIGLVGINRIEGSYFTVMGLPTHLLYKMLVNFAS